MMRRKILFDFAVVAVQLWYRLMNADQNCRIDELPLIDAFPVLPICGARHVPSVAVRCWYVDSVDHCRLCVLAAVTIGDVLSLTVRKCHSPMGRFLFFAAVFLWRRLVWSA